MLALQNKILNIENGMIRQRQMCWGCGEIHEIEIPVDDVGTDAESAIMCLDCVVKFCQED